MKALTARARHARSPGRSPPCRRARAGRRRSCSSHPADPRHTRDPHHLRNLEYLQRCCLIDWRLHEIIRRPGTIGVSRTHGNVARIDRYSISMFCAELLGTDSREQPTATRRRCQSNPARLVLQGGHRPRRTRDIRPFGADAYRRHPTAIREGRRRDSDETRAIGIPDRPNRAEGKLRNDRARVLTGRNPPDSSRAEPDYYSRNSILAKTLHCWAARRCRGMLRPVRPAAPRMEPRLDEVADHHRPTSRDIDGPIAIRSPSRRRR